MEVRRYQTPRQESVDYTQLSITIPPRPESRIPIAQPDLELMPSPETYAYQNLVTGLQTRVGNLVTDSEVKLTLRDVPSKPGIDADFSIPCFALANALRRNSRDISEELSQQMAADNIPLVKAVSALKGHINIEVDSNTLGQAVLSQIEAFGDRYGEQNIGNGQTVIVDCSSPNVAKYMSVAHLRSTVIGESIARIHRACGFTTIRDNHLGDWGTQFGMLAHAYELWSTEVPELVDRTDPIGGLYKLYVKMHAEIEKEKAAVEEIKKSRSNMDGRTPLSAFEEEQLSPLQTEGRRWFQKLETGDPKARELWQWALDLSLVEFQRVYELLGVDFEYALGESAYVGMLSQVIDAFKTKGLAQQDPEGPVKVDLQSTHLGNMVIQKTDGASVYATREFATLIARDAWFNPAKLVYVVGGDQKEYFKQVFEAFRRLTDGNTPELEHVWFGLISLPEGKMSTRRGNVVFLEDVLTESIARARSIITSRSEKQFSDEEIDIISRQVGVGAVIYFYLVHDRKRDIKFDWDTALSFTGNSAPYLQYTYVRAKAITRKAEEQKFVFDPTIEVAVSQPIEKTLLIELGRFPDIVRKAMETNQPSIISEIIFKIATLFNEFYQNKDVQVLKPKGQKLTPEEETKHNSRLRLTSATAQVIKNGLSLLNIETPERM